MKAPPLVPASHFFEFTGTKSPKSKWKFTKTGEEWFCFAGLWRPMPDGQGDAFTLLTTEPGRMSLPSITARLLSSNVRNGRPGSIPTTQKHFFSGRFQPGA
jgi:hypothetical protein